MKTNEGAKAPLYDVFFDNLEKDKKIVDEISNENLLSLINVIICKVESAFHQQHGLYFNEVEAAQFLRISNPFTTGKNTIRNYALRSRKLPFAKIGREGLLFHKKDLENLFQQLKAENIRDL